ncbi:MAG TPA: hypothetical protein VN715_00975 [Roseiarcus sp.]|nr:hypothetical protein [Roseiarcus sp.]
MSPDCFLDTNVLFYAAMGRFSAPEKYLNDGQAYGFVRALNPFKPH